MHAWLGSAKSPPSPCRGLPTALGSAAPPSNHQHPASCLLHQVASQVISLRTDRAAVARQRGARTAAAGARLLAALMLLTDARRCTGAATKAAWTRRPAGRLWLLAAAKRQEAATWVAAMLLRRFCEWLASAMWHDGRLGLAHACARGAPSGWLSFVARDAPGAPIAPSIAASLYARPQ